MNKMDRARSVERFPSAAPIEDYLAKLHRRISKTTGGTVANYIPELGKADPNLFGIALATIDGQLYATGDTDRTFTIQSVSKPFMYGHALDEHGRDFVLRHVGVEPTGEVFNSIVLDEVANRPFNPMVNAGAIAVAALVRRSATGSLPVTAAPRIFRANSFAWSTVRMPYRPKVACRSVPVRPPPTRYRAMKVLRPVGSTLSPKPGSSESQTTYRWLLGLARSTVFFVSLSDGRLWSSRERLVITWSSRHKETRGHA
jgi:hypothetical protein